MIPSNRREPDQSHGFSCDVRRMPSRELGLRSRRQWSRPRSTDYLKSRANGNNALIIAVGFHPSLTFQRKDISQAIDLPILFGDGAEAVHRQ